MSGERFGKFISCLGFIFMIAGAISCFLGLSLFYLDGFKIIYMATPLWPGIMLIGGMVVSLGGARLFFRKKNNGGI